MEGSDGGAVGAGAANTAANTAGAAWWLGPSLLLPFPHCICIGSLHFCFGNISSSSHKNVFSCLEEPPSLWALLSQTAAKAGPTCLFACLFVYQWVPVIIDSTHCSPRALGNSALSSQVGRHPSIPSDKALPSTGLLSHCKRWLWLILQLLFLFYRGIK